MAGQVKKLINELIEKRSKGNPIIASSTRTKLILKGINPLKFDENSDDDSAVLDKLNQMISEL